MTATPLRPVSDATRPVQSFVSPFQSRPRFPALPEVDGPGRLKLPMDRKKQTLFTVPLLVLTLIAAGFFYVKVVMVRTEYNRIVTELIDEGKYDEAATAFEALLPRSIGKMTTQVSRDLAETYRALGDDPGLNYDGSRQHFQRAFELDPEGMQPHQMRVLQSAPGKGATAN